MDEVSESPRKPRTRLEWRDNSWWVILSTTEMTLDDFIELSDDLLHDLNISGRKVTRRKRRRETQL
jgi:hypothetical protein